MALGPKRKLRPQRRRPLIAGMMPKPSSPKPPASSGGNGKAKSIALAILPIALLGYAVFASGLVSFPAGKQGVAHPVAGVEPSNSAINADQDEGNTVGRMGIGVRVANLTPNVIKSLGLQTNRLQGVVITGVRPRSSAERIGLTKGDIILAVDGTPVSEYDELLTKIKYTPINQDLTIIFERGGVTQAVQVKVERWCIQEDDIRARFRPRAETPPLDHIVRESELNVPVYLDPIQRNAIRPGTSRECL